VGVNPFSFDETLGVYGFHFFEEELGASRDFDFTDSDMEWSGEFDFVHVGFVVEE
jgi:hypothetical protein